jgi:hypothetical protein
MKEGRPDKETASIEAVSQTKVAQQLNVGRPSVQRGMTVLNKVVSELRKMVDRGSVSVRAAAEIAEQPEEKQQEIVMRGAYVLSESGFKTIPRVSIRSDPLRPSCGRL